MSVVVKITNGSYRNNPVNGQFALLKDYVQGQNGGFITVDGTAKFGQDKVRVKVSRSNYEIVSGDATSLIAAQNSGHAEQAEQDIADEPVSTETDEEIEARINNRFEILQGMTRAMTDGGIIAMTVTGAPGVGKSYGVEEELEKYSMMDKIAGREASWEIVKGAMTPIGLYSHLFKMQEKGKITVFDDCDMILQDDLSLNILKAALDTSKTRRISWHADSKLLQREGIPHSFNFSGSVIFISNINFNNVRSKTLAPHLEALKTRCHFLDLTIHTTREKLIRINSLLNKGMLDDMYMTEEQIADVKRYINEKAAHLQDLSLRMVLKVAQLIKAFPEKWEEVAAHTVLKNASRA